MLGLDLISLAAEELEVLFAIFTFLIQLVSEEDAVLTAFNPGGFWHRSVNLLQIEL